MTNSPTRAADPGRAIARIALENTGSEMLEAVIRFAFDQLCWVRTTPQLEAFVEGLKTIVDDEGGGE